MNPKDYIADLEANLVSCQAREEELREEVGNLKFGLDATAAAENRALHLLGECRAREEQLRTAWFNTRPLPQRGQHHHSGPGDPGDCYVCAVEAIRRTALAPSLAEPETPTDGADPDVMAMQTFDAREHSEAIEAAEAETCPTCENTLAEGRLEFPCSVCMGRGYVREDNAGWERLGAERACPRTELCPDPFHAATQEKTPKEGR